jgi:phenylpropionate dioxygenase-like ring-hydroxylating dioxygenase large terminal subunit
MMGDNSNANLVLADASRRQVRGSYDTVLDREYYVSEETFEKERARVFARQWTFAGHVSDIPKVGDYFLHNFAGESIIVVREAEDRISAHLNVCRHRGYALCKSTSGHARSFTCPYHQWTYQLDGSLKRAPGMPDGECFEYKDWGLFRVASEVWAGMIFVWIGSETPPTLLSKWGEPGPTVRQIEPENLREAHRETLKIQSNWKTLLENYLECYHCAASHPELGIPFDIQAAFKQTGGWTGEYLVAGGEPLRQGMKTVSRDGSLVCPPLGTFNGKSDVPSGYDEGLTIIPTLTRILFHIDHAVVHTMNPISAGEVHWTTRWYVHSGAMEGRDYNVEALTEVWKATNRQDQMLCEGNYAGVKSRRFMPGPLNPKTEGALRPALNIYLELMSR